MNLHCKLAPLAFVGVCICTGVALGQPVAEKPNWKVGDYWEFRQMTTPGDQTATWSRKIEAFLPDGNIQVRFDNGKLEQYDAALNFMSNGRADGVRILARHPLKVGAEWTFTANMGARLVKFTPGN